MRELIERLEELVGSTNPSSLTVKFSGHFKSNLNGRKKRLNKSVAYSKRDSTLNKIYSESEISFSSRFPWKFKYIKGSDRIVGLVCSYKGKNDDIIMEIRSDSPSSVQWSTLVDEVARDLIDRDNLNNNWQYLGDKT